MELKAPDEETMLRAAVADLEIRFRSIDHSRIESTARRLVREWFERARVKTFVGIIAERHARTELEQTQAEGAEPDRVTADGDGRPR